MYYSFNASNGWFEKFIRRYRLSHRNRTSKEAPLILKKPFENHLKKDIIEFYEGLDNKLEKIEKKLKREDPNNK